MDQRRYLLFVLVTMGFFLLWMQVAPLLFPNAFPQAPPKVPQAAREQRAVVDGAEPAAAEVEPAPEPDELPTFNRQTVLLGEPGFADGFLIQAQLSTKGGSVDWVQLTDPRYTTLDRREQLKVVGNPIDRNVGRGDVPNTFESSVDVIDAQLEKHGLSLAEVDWEISARNADSVTFRYPSPDGTLEVLKTYRVKAADLNQIDSSPDGYFLDMELVLRNLSQRQVKTRFSLVGPVGLPLENLENTRLFREIKLGMIENPRKPHSITPINLIAQNLVAQYDKAAGGGKEMDSWRETVHFAGLDVQFFAALVFPDGARLVDPDRDFLPQQDFEVVRPLLLQKASQKEHSNFTIVMESPEMTIQADPEQPLRQHFKAFFGPKRPELLEPLQAGSVIQFGWFKSIAKLMLLVLGFFHHSIGLSYALSIMLLTVVVRGLMFPISRKQVIEAEKMKILAPKLKEIQEKHKGQPEEFAKAYREFQKKHNYHPMIGCLPALLQLPIFIGLYQALFQAIDLRLAQFLWMDNLAAPDALFHFGFAIPWFGWTTFNLLPILTVILFVIQQKMFAPPPTSPEQEMQYKMMNIMMIVIGVLFYSVPAGLCLYFIASSLWGLTERQLLKKFGHTQEKAEEDLGGEKKTATKTETPAKEAKPPGFLERMLEAADQAKHQTEGQTSRRFSKESNKKAGKTRPRR